MAALLAALGSPERAVPAVLVAGTNGKGSTAALLASCAQAAGWRTGLYTSPHLERAEERLRIAGRSITSSLLLDLLHEVVAATPHLPTYFEAFTAAAFLHFARQRLDLAIVEVGLGGRLDATNLCDPILSVVTPIDLDHQELLGSTRAAIAREKAGIFRPGRPAIVHPDNREAAAALAAAAAAVGTRLLDVGRWAEAAVVTDLGWEGQRVACTTPRGAAWELALPLSGRHQAENLVLALSALESCAELGFPVDRRAICAGVAAWRWPGRLESVLLPDGARVLIDAAHNPAGVTALRAFLLARGEPFTLLFGGLADKDLGAMLPPLAELAEEVVLTAPASPRAAPPEALAALLPDRSRVTVAPDREAALARALAAGAPLTVLCGSIYLIGELRQALRRRYGVPPPPE